MQTFLPHVDFVESARVLDRQRLGKQRVEAWQVFCALDDSTNGWHNHACTRMWRDYPWWLVRYGLAICTEWRKRGYDDGMLQRFAYEDLRVDPTPKPWWLGVEALHLSHRRALVAKAPDWYGQFWPDEIPEINYWWPV